MNGFFEDREKTADEPDYEAEERDRREDAQTDKWERLDQDGEE